MNSRLKNRKNHKKINIILVSCLILFIGLGAAISETSLKNSSIVSMSTNLWDVHFANLVVVSSSAEVTKAAAIDTTDATLINFGVNFKKRGEKYEFKVNVVNLGAFAAKISAINLGGLSTAQKKYINYTAKYSSGEEIKIGDILPPGSSQTILISVSYVEGLDLDLYPRTDQSTELYYKITYSQEADPSSSQSYKWDIHFANLSVIKNSTSSSSAKINTFDNTKINFNLNLGLPGQTYIFQTDIVNNSTYNAKISNIQLNGLSNEQKKYITFNVTYSDGTIINTNDILTAGSSKKIKATITYIAGLDDNLYPKADQDIALEFIITYDQQT